MVGRGARTGIRAKRENSSTRRLRPSTSWMIVSVHSATSCCSSPEPPRSRRLRRWADSWMGVSGFLISWAMRWATSRQAATRWAFRSSVRSSKTTTAPVYSPSGPRSAVAEARSESVAPPRRSWSSCSIAPPFARGARWTSALTSRKAGPTNTSSRSLPTAPGWARPNIRAAARLMVVRRPSGSKETTPVVMASSTVSV